MSLFQTTVNQLLKVLEKQSSHLNQHKLYAIGLRNKLNNEKQQRKEKENDLKSLISQNLRELERCQIEFDSLCKTEQFQQNEIQKFKKMD